MDVAVCTPWRAAPHRLAAQNRCLKFWMDNGFTVVYGDSDPHLPFLYSQALNNAVRLAQTDVVVLADADVLPHDITQIHAAADVATEGFNVVLPFKFHREIPSEFVDSDDLSKAPVLNEDQEMPGGIVVCSRETYWALNGFDENFVPGAWGFHDTAFLYAAATLAKVWRMPGVTYAFRHTVDRDATETNPNYARYELYEFAKGKPEVMRTLLGLPHNAQGTAFS